MTIVKHATKEKYQTPPEAPVTLYAIRRAELDAKKLLEAKTTKLCITTGMTRTAALAAIKAGYFETSDAPDDEQR